MVGVLVVGVVVERVFVVRVVLVGVLVERVLVVGVLVVGFVVERLVLVWSDVECVVLVVVLMG